MQLIQTPQGPRVALSVAAVTIVALESKVPAAQHAAVAWLRAYQRFRADGLSDLQARGLAADAWDATMAVT